MSSGNQNAESTERRKSENDDVKEGEDQGNSGTKDYHYEQYTDENWPEKECYKLTKDGQVRKIILKKSSSTQTPKALGRIWMNVKGKTSKGIVFEDLMFEERDIILGQGEHCKGVEMAVVTMNVGDHCVVEVDSAEYSYRNESLPRNCPKNNDQMDFPLTFEVILVDCMPPLKSLLGTSFEERFQLVQLFREKGNQRYEKKRYLTAMKLYEKAIEIFEKMHKNEDSEFDEERTKCYMNCSACALQLKKYQKAIHYADSALAINPQAPKALLRRALGLKALHRLDQALHDIEAVLAMPNLDAAIIETANKQLQVVKKEIETSKLESSSSTSNGWSQKAVEVLSTAAFGLIDVCLNCCRKKKKHE